MNGKGRVVVVGTSCCCCRRVCVFQFFFLICVVVLLLSSVRRWRHPYKAHKTLKKGQKIWNEMDVVFIFLGLTWPNQELNLVNV